MLFDEQLAASTDDSLRLSWNPPVVRELDSVDAKKERFLAELDEWTTAAKARREKDAVHRQSFKGIARMHAHRRAELEGLIRYCRERPNADVTLALFILIVLESDNDEFGACYLSIPRMAEALNRIPDTIRAGIERLIEAGLIGSQERCGNTTLHWPLVHPSFGEKPSLHWLVEHYAPMRKAGRPGKNPLRPEPKGFSDETPSGDNPGGFKNPSGPDRKTPQARTRDDSSNDLAKKRESGAATPSLSLEDVHANAQGKNSADSSSAPPVAPNGAAADHPDPRHPPPAVAQPPKTDRHGTRLPDEWTLPDEWRDWALSEFTVTAAQVQADADTFRDHWCAQPGQKGRKTDWIATWRNWCRRSKGFTPRPNGSARPPADEFWSDDQSRWLLQHYGIRSLRDWDQRRDAVGPPPYEAGCKVSPAVRAELGLTDTGPLA